jgi:hypothetical protein
MALVKSTLAQQLEDVLKRKSGTAADAAAGWATAYVSYAASAMSSASSLATTAAANQGVLVSAFSAAFSSQTSAGAAAAIETGVMSFWTAMVWAGPTAVGSTLSPGNAGLSAALAAIFADTSKQSESDKANHLADAFDAGARLVIVNDVPLVQPAPPIVGPIS